jgi:hypothetical protein
MGMSSAIGVEIGVRIGVVTCEVVVDGILQTPARGRWGIEIDKAIEIAEKSQPCSQSLNV